MIFLKLFYTFLLIGVFTFGGGYAMLSLIQDQVVVNNAWITAEQFTDIVAISQATLQSVGLRGRKPHCNPGCGNPIFHHRAGNMQTLPESQEERPVQIADERNKAGGNWNDCSGGRNTDYAPELLPLEQLAPSCWSFHKLQVL